MTEVDKVIRELGQELDGYRWKGVTELDLASRLRRVATRENRLRQLVDPANGIGLSSMADHARARLATVRPMPPRPSFR